MRPYALIYLYRRRLRAHAAQEVLAGLGVAIAVALVFAVLVANESIAGSTAQVVRTVVGPASLQLRSRGPEGFDEALLTRVERLPGVKQAAPALEQTATIVGPTGRHLALDVVGTDVSLAILDGLAHTLPGAVFSPHGVGLTAGAAGELGVSASGLKEGVPEVVSLAIRGRASRLKVSAVLGEEAAGALYQTRAALMPLASLQALSGLKGRVSRILVQAQPGRRAAVQAELERVAAGRLEVAPAHEDVALLRQALHPADQASMFFAVIAALLGFLFAFNAMLLTVPERRQAIADLRVDGAKRTAIVQMVLFQALCLGTGASLLGLLVGYVLSRHVFHESPGYLAQTFVLGQGTVVGTAPLLLALGGGIFAALLASAVPLLDLRGGRAIDAVYFEDGAPGNALSRHVQRRLFIAAVGLLAPATLLFILAPTAAVFASVLLALATVFAVPLILAAVLRVAGRMPKQIQSFMLLPIALTALRATTVRSLALAATGAIALFGTVALGGARADLLSALHTFARNYSAEAAVWVMNPRDTAGVISFRPAAYAARIEHIPGVTRVRTYQSEFMNMGGRRVWVIARPASAQAQVLRGQIIDGDAARAASELRAGGWIAVSQPIAAEQHARVGGIVRVPTPSGTASFRLAATTTNFGWTSGALLMNTADYSRLWATDAPTALGVDLAPGTNPGRARLAIARALGPGTGLEVITANTRATRFGAIAEEGLGRLAEISMMLAIAAVLALVAALGSAIWERRTSLSGLRLEGAPPSRLRRILLTESMLMLGAGCLTGVLAGIFGQVVIDGYLKRTTGFPVATIAATWRPLEIFAIVVAIVLALASLPSWSASRVSSALALEAE
jgi:putative ABC transport system permease protein